MQMWVFGYGSLLWDPGFDFVEKRLARLSGYRRNFCMRSIHHRGTPAAPGLVLALDAANAAPCDGLAFRIAPKDEAQVLVYLRERELVSSAYYEQTVRLDLPEGGQLEALAYVIDRFQTWEGWGRGGGSGDTQGRSIFWSFCICCKVFKDCWAYPGGSNPQGKRSDPF